MVCGIIDTAAPLSIPMRMHDVDVDDGDGDALALTALMYKPSSVRALSSSPPVPADDVAAAAACSSTLPTCCLGTFGLPAAFALQSLAKCPGFWHQWHKSFADAVLRPGDCCCCALPPLPLLPFLLPFPPCFCQQSVSLCPAFPQNAHLWPFPPFVTAPTSMGVAAVNAMCRSLASRLKSSHRRNDSERKSRCCRKCPSGMPFNTMPMRIMSLTVSPLSRSHCRMSLSNVSNWFTKSCPLNWKPNNVISAPA
eukprot:6473808-Amphidinium_carterae.1